MGTRPRSKGDGLTSGNESPIIGSARGEYLARMSEAALEFERDGFLPSKDVVAIPEAAAARPLW